MDRNDFEQNGLAISGNKNKKKYMYKKKHSCGCE